MRLSERVSSMQFSPIRGFNKLAAAEEAKGKKIYHLNIGQPDVETPETTVYYYRSTVEGSFIDNCNPVEDFVNAYGHLIKAVITKK